MENTECEQVPWLVMSRRIDIELTSALADGSWTWRAAGARKPNGVLDGSILPDGAKVGDEIKVEMEQMLEGVEILSVVKGRHKPGGANVIEILPSSEPFEAVIETRARRSRPEGKSGDRDRPRRDRDSRPREGRSRDDRSRDDRKGDDRKRDDRSGSGRESRSGDDRPARSPRRDRPHFEAPPELPQRPKPKRLRPGKARRNAVLAEIPEEQRPLAELASQGMAAVRTRVKEENAKLEASGQPAMPEASVLKMAEELLPKLRVADWLDRAEAAQRQMEHLDLRDLRSVIASGDDSTIARDETARALNIDLKAALVRRQDEELHLWIGDIDAALGVGRVIRALRLSSQPPKAGVMFPPELARRLGEAAGQSLQPTDSGDRWIAVLEAAAFSPVRSLVVPAAPPETISDDLRSTVVRLGPALPQIAALLAVEVPAGTPQPKPLRPNPRQDAKRRPAKASGARPDQKPKATPPEGKRDAPAARSAKPADETKPADAKPTADAKPAEPAEAEAESAKPADDAGPADEAKPTDAGKPAEDAGPADEAKPADGPRGRSRTGGSRHAACRSRSGTGGARSRRAPDRAGLAAGRTRRRNDGARRAAGASRHACGRARSRSDGDGRRVRAGQCRVVGAQGRTVCGGGRFITSRRRTRRRARLRRRDPACLIVCGRHSAVPQHDVCRKFRRRNLWQTSLRPEGMLSAANRVSAHARRRLDE